MRLPIVYARILLSLFVAFGFFIHQFSSKHIEDFLQSIPYHCPLRWITGWKCAFCGMTHSWIAMFRGNLLLAFQENLFGPILWIGTVGALVLFSLNGKIKINPRPIAAISIAVLCVYAIARNLF